MATYWPHHDDNPFAGHFNSIPKYVASRGRPGLSWAGSTQLGPDLAGAVREVRDWHEHVKVVGSLNLVQALCARNSASVLTSGRTRSCSASGTRCSRYAGQVPALLRAQYRRRGSPERVVAVWAISWAGWSTAGEAITMGEP
jgi:hypothetical protein